MLFPSREIGFGDGLIWWFDCVISKVSLEVGYWHLRIPVILPFLYRISTKGLIGNYCHPFLLEWSRAHFTIAFSCFLKNVYFFLFISSIRFIKVRLTPNSTISVLIRRWLYEERDTRGESHVMIKTEMKLYSYKPRNTKGCWQTTRI